ncbi:MAG: hypothetical protein GKS01_05985 [Alphaproteobacteria bacterium]|nr:hypothetical protein [Alphaproteobacteria bacterium]
MVLTLKKRYPYKRTIFAMVCLFSIGAVTFSSYAQKPTLPIANQDPSVVAAERFINSIRTLKAPFVQASSSGSYARGNIYIQRPGLLRIDYDKPTSLQVYADGTWLFYIDEELKDVSQIPLNATPASFLVRENFSFTDGLTIQKVEKRNRTIRIQVARRGEEDSGSLTLLLSEGADAFRGWTVTDPQGVRTTVSLLSPILNQSIAKQIFVFTPPDWAFPEDVQE